MNIYVHSSFTCLSPSPPSLPVLVIKQAYWIEGPLLILAERPLYLMMVDPLFRKEELFVYIMRDYAGMEPHYAPILCSPMNIIKYHIKHCDVWTCWPLL